MPNLSPLRYPGGKTRAVKILKSYLPPDTIEICSPFFGGGSFELSCAKEGIKVAGYDIFKPLVDFWNCLLKHPEKLADMVMKYHPLTKDVFYQLQKNHINLKTPLDRAAAFFVLNRASFSGSTLSGGMSPEHPRFTESSISRIREFNIPGFTVREKSFKESIKENSDKLLYLDPPYFIKGNLYGDKGDAHRGFDHRGLCNLLKTRGKWILSYNNCPEIIDMYSEYRVHYPSWKYGMSSDKNSREVLILSEDI